MLTPTETDAMHIKLGYYPARLIVEMYSVHGLPMTETIIFCSQRYGKLKFPYYELVSRLKDIGVNSPESKILEIKEDLKLILGD